MNMTRTVTLLAIMCLVIVGPVLSPSPQAAAAVVQEAWKADFDDICAKTENPLALTTEELKSLIARCDKLKLRIEQLDESAAKVYLKRLKMCRDLYMFSLESKAR
jgi:hypothetical protein